MSEKTAKDTIDGFFDVVDKALAPVETVLRRDPAPQKHDALDVSDVDDQRHEDWENHWKETQWGCVAGTWHGFRESSMSPVCNPSLTFSSHQVENRQVLSHGICIVACTSCIIAVSKP